MKVNLEARYAPFGGIEKVFESYKKGSLTLEDISRKARVSKTSVSNDLRNTYGVDALEQARSDRRRVSSLEKRITDINKGAGAELEYDEAKRHLENGDIKSTGFLALFSQIIDLAKPYTGKPSVVWFSGQSICKIQGAKGCVKVRSAIPSPKSKEYQINRYRFKVTPAQMDDFDACIFCIRDGGKVSIYSFPANEINKIQSLNLKFKEHENTKYSGFLAKVEDIS